MIETPSLVSANGPSHSPIANQSTTPDKSEEQSSEIQCICGFHDDDGYTICCDQCDTWQHLYCVDIKSDRVPDTYLCPNCLPRPLDVRKAKEHQQSRRERKEREKAKSRNRKKPNSNTSASKKKETSNHGNGTLQGNGPGPPMPDKGSGTGKPQSPKDGQQGYRKRGPHRASISNVSSHGLLADGVLPPLEAFTANVAATASSPGFVSSGMEIDSDIDVDNLKKYRYDFTDITDSPDNYENGEIQSFIASIRSHSDDSIQHYTRETFNATSFPNLSVHEFPDSMTAYSSIHRSFVTVDASCLTRQPVALCKGDIRFQRDYKNEAINQFLIWRHPKPFVFFHPDQPICIDSRIRGTVARFVKRSCHPNVCLKTIVIDNSEVLFGFFAVEPLQPNTALTIEWDWSGSPAIQRIRQGTDLDDLTFEEHQEASSWVQYLMENFGDCACSGISECPFYKLRLKPELTFVKPYSLNGKDNTNFAASDPLYTPNHDTSTPRRKSRSPDLSPSTVNCEVSDIEMSHREARKIRNLVTRFEKLEQEEQPQGNKRRKKSSVFNTQIVTSGLPPPSTVDWKDSAKLSENGKKVQNSSAISSPPYTPQPSEGPGEHGLSPQDCSSSRSPASDNPQMSAHSIPTLGLALEKSKTPIKILKRPQYVDASTQTDASEGPWWLNEDTHAGPLKPASMSLKKRLMRDLLREKKKETNRVSEYKKRKLQEIETLTLVNVEKGPKLSLEDDVKTARGSLKSPLVAAGEHLERKQSQHTFKSEFNMYADVGTCATVPHFAPANMPVNAKQISLIKSEEFLSEHPMTPCDDAEIEDSAITNGHRKVALSVQLPPPPNFTSPTTNSSISPILTPQSQLHSPPALSSCATMFSPIALTPTGLGAHPGPTKMKKLSLSEYNRRKKADAHEKDKSGTTPSKISSVAMRPIHEKLMKSGDNEQSFLEVHEAPPSLHDGSS